MSELLGVLDQLAATIGRASVLAQRASVLASAQPAPVPAPGPAPAPVPGTIPDGANLVQIGSSTYPLAAVNPTQASNPDGFAQTGWNGRGPDQLILCAPPWLTTGANGYGTEALVSSGTVTSMRLGTGDSTIPAGGYVLSGHGKASGWLRANAGPGKTVQVLHVDQPAPVPAPVPPPTPGGKTLAVYLMDGKGTISQVAPNITQVRVAFLQGTKLVEWGGDTPAKTAADLTSWRTGARETLVSIGGQGGAVSMGAIVGAFHTIETVAPSFPVNGPDWDVEAGGLDVATAVAVSKELARGRGDSWVTSFVPPGGPPVARYLDAARQCQAAGLRVQFGQQLYDTRITLDDVIRQTQLAVDALGQESVLVGCMVGTDPSRYSTIDQWVAYIDAVVKKWPKIGGAYLWESSRDGTAEWARRVGQVLGL